MPEFLGDQASLLPAIWAGLIGTAVAMYVILDGFDLGVGILFPWFRREDERDLMMNSVAPFWDGNETWLILGGGGLLVAFPLAYSVILPAVYLPVIVMLLALIFRGTAFEFRWVAKPRHRKWDYAFAGGSTAAAFAQGVVLGSLLQGVTVRDNAFAGGPLDWLTPFALFCGLALVLGYALLGATWLNMRVEGEVALRARRMAQYLLLAVLGAMGVVSVWTPLMIDRVFQRWFSLPDFFYFAPVPLLALAAALYCWRALERGRAAAPFLAAIALFLLGFLGLVVSNLPYIVPPSITIWQAAAAPESQKFMLIGTVVLLPLILGYTAFVYWTFRGRIGRGEGYH